MQPCLTLGKLAYPQTNPNPKRKNHLAVGSELQQPQPLQIHCILGSNHIVQTLATVVLQRTDAHDPQIQMAEGKALGQSSEFLFTRTSTRDQYDSRCPGPHASRAPPENEK